MKKYTHIALSIIFIMSLSNSILSNAKYDNKVTTEKKNPSSPIDSIIEDFDKWMYGDEKTKGVADHARDAFIEAEKRVSDMMHQLSQTARHLRDESLEHAQQAFEKTSTLMKQGAKKLDAMKKKLANDIKEKKKNKHYAVHKYFDNKKKIHGAKITLPGIKRDDIKITITDKKTKNGNTKLVELTAQKQQPDDKHFHYTLSRSMQSQSIINNKQKKTGYHIRYKDGLVTVTINFPDTINEKNYSMKFDDEELTIEFQEKQDKRKLNFTR